ncbi:MAG TPA: ATP-binding protein, partial [Longimicrobium sp.]|nr:ATP-binding protein [Longimicrobium sp.]
DLARVEAGTRRAESEDVDLAALVESVGEAMRGAAEAKGLALEVEVDAAAGRARTDAGLVRQILSNLLGNALKFTDAGAVRVRARRDGERVVIEVADTGPGIAPEHQEKVFEAFFQVDPSTTRREGGTGLGLALSREFAALLGGEVTLHCAPGEGSTFALILPADGSA